MSVEVLSKGKPTHHCELPSWKLRRKLHIKIDDKVKCKDCGAVWQWQEIGTLISTGDWVRVTIR